MGYDNVLFDLDGTVADPYSGITNSVKYALDKFNIIEKDNEKLKLFIGPPLEKSFIEYYNFTATDAKAAVNYYRAYYSEKGINENKLYAGIDIVLKKLNGKNSNCIIATSKLEKYAIQVVKNFNIDIYFKYIAGSNLDGTLLEKGDIIRYIIEKYTLDKDTTIMVGDRKYDIIGAKENGIKSIGVLYGYGSKKELDEAKPTYMCKNIEKLSELLA
jgi:phosphoglycolate phosphatase